MDILIINPGVIRHDYITEHLGIASLKAYLISKDFAADTLDMAIEELSVLDGARKILDLKPKMVGLSLLDDSKDKGLSLIKTIRKMGYAGEIVVGGYFATFASREILRDFPEIDYVVRGEGELTLAELMECVIRQKEKPFSQIAGLSYRDNGLIIGNSPRPLIRNLDILPPVDRKYAPPVLKSGSHLRIYGTRGCWGQCTFCDIVGFYHTSPGKVWRRRSVNHLVDEIEQLKNQFNTDFFVFNDDQFLIKGEKGGGLVDAFAAELERRRLKVRFELMCRPDTVNRKIMQRLKSVGLHRVFLGLESFDQKQLQRYRKKIPVRQNLKALITLYQLKIDVIASVILADAFTTLWDLIKHFMVLFELKKRYFNSPNCQISVNNKLEIYRGSALYREYRKKGLLTKDHYLEGYDFRLKFWTGIRLKLFESEMKITRLLLKPAEVFKNMISRAGWHFSQFKKIVSYRLEVKGQRITF